jgi:serine/threonine protein kinase
VKIVRREQHTSAESFEREFKGLQKFEPVSRTHEGLVDILTLGLLPTGAGFYYVMELADAVTNPNSEIRDPKEGRNPKTEAPTANDPIRPSGFGPLSAFDLRPSDLYLPRTLRAELKSRGALPANEVIALGLKLAAALAHLHAHGLVHRDVKPSNILFIGGEPKLADAGLVAAVDDALSLVGTAGYIAPEGPGTPQADLYALGKVLYEAAFGKDRKEFPALPSDVASRPDHARLLELNEIIARACAHDPQQRYQRAEDMRPELELLQRGDSVKRRRRTERRWVVGKKVLVVGVGVLAVLAIFLSQARHSQGFRSKVPGVDVLVEQGNEILKRRTPEGLTNALHSFYQAAQKDPGSAPALIGIFQARLLRFSSDFANPPTNEDVNLRVAATNLIKLRPDLAEARIASSVLHYLDGNLPTALADARKAAKMPTASPNGFALVHFECGWYSMNTFDPEGGLRELLLAESARPSDPFIETFVGLAYALLHDFPKALEHYDTAIRLEPAQNVVYENRANVYREQGKILEGIQDFETFWRMAGGSEPKDTNNRFNELRSAFQQGGPEAYWRKNLENQLRVTPPDDPHEVAASLVHLGRLQEAYDCLNRIEDPGRLRECLWFDISFDRSDTRFKALVSRCGSAVTPAAEYFPGHR